MPHAAGADDDAARTSLSIQNLIDAILYMQINFTFLQAPLECQFILPLQTVWPWDININDKYNGHSVYSYGNIHRCRTDAGWRRAVWHVIGAVQKLAHTFLEITDTTSLKSQDPLFAAGGRDSWFSPCNVLNDRRCCGVCDVRI